MVLIHLVTYNFVLGSKKRQFWTHYPVLRTPQNAWHKLHFTFWQICT